MKGRLALLGGLLLGAVWPAAGNPAPPPPAGQDPGEVATAPVLRLETGIFQREAIGLYESSGFYRIPPFGSYKFDPLSVYFEKKL